MKTGLTILSIIIALFIIGWAVWVNLEETDPETEKNVNQELQLTSGQLDYSEITNLANCQTIECALQMMDNEEIADFQLKNWLQTYSMESGQFTECDWNWDLFEERITELKTIRKKLLTEGRHQSIGISCDFLKEF